MVISSRRGFTLPGRWFGVQAKVLLTVYAKCLDGQRSVYNERITTLLDE